MYRVLKPGLAYLVLLTGVTAQPLTLERAIRVALENNSDALLARARLMELESMEALAESGSYPTVSIRGNYQQTTNPMQGFGAILSEGTFDNTINFNDPGQIDQLTGAVEARYRIYSGGERKASIESARKMRTAGSHALESAEINLEAAVVETYFAIRQSDEILRSIESGIHHLEENLRISRLRESSGELIRSERLNLEVELASRRQDLLSQEHESEMRRIKMAYLLGLPAGETIELAGEDASVGKLVYPDSPGIESRPELLAAEAMAQAASGQVRAARSGRLPKMDAYASWQADKGWRREGSGTSWTAGLSMQVAIFDGWATRSKVGVAWAKERAAEERVRQTRLNLQMELEQALRFHELAKGQKAVAVKQVEQSREVARLSRKQFAAGTLLSTELIGVESRLVDAEVQLALATSKEWISLARLRRVSGQRILF